MGNNPISMIDPDGGNCFDSNNNPVPCGDMNQAYNNSTNNITQLDAVIIGGNPKTNYVSSGAYGWNDGSAERFWNEYMPLTSSFNTFIEGAKNGNKSDMAWGAALFVLDIFSFGEGSVGVKAISKSEKLIDIYTATRNGRKYVGQSVNYLTRYTKGIFKEMRPQLIAKVPARLANAAEQQMMSVHGLFNKTDDILKSVGNGLADNRRLQMSLKNQIENKKLMKEAMEWLDTNVPQWMEW